MASFYAKKAPHALVTHLAPIDSPHLLPQHNADIIFDSPSSPRFPMHHVHYNRSMLLAAVLPMVLIVVSCVFLMLHGADVARERFLFGVLHPPYFFYPITSVIIISFAQYAFHPLRKLLRQKPALRWGKAGITLANGSRVAWVAIETIHIQQRKNQCHILIFLDEPLAFIDMQSPHRQPKARQHWRRFQTPVAIDCTELDVDAQVLLNALQSHHQKNRL